VTEPKATGIVHIEYIDLVRIGKSSVRINHDQPLAIAVPRAVLFILGAVERITAGK
jgi:hypothetical protein